MCTKARHVAISFEVVEWSEQLRSVTSAWLGAVVVAFKSESAPAGVRVRKKFGVISPPRDLLPSIVLILSPTFSHCLSFFPTSILFLLGRYGRRLQ